MNQKTGLLGGLVLLQLALVALFLFGGNGTDSAPAQFLDFAPEAADQLEIRDAERALNLQRDDAGWQVESLPADAAKVDQLLEKMAGLTAPWPVAQSAASAERFEVQADNFQRHVTVRSGGEAVADLYLGTSPGYQRVHARRTDSDDIYSISLSNFELGVGVDSWLDKSLLALTEAPTEVVVEYTAETQSTQTLVKRTGPAEGWWINGAAADPDAATTYVNRFANLQVLGVADDEQVAQATRLATIKAGDAASLTVMRIGEDGDYLVRAEALTTTFRMATYIAEQLLMNDLELAAADDPAVAAEDAEEVREPEEDEPEGEE